MNQPTTSTRTAGSAGRRWPRRAVLPALGVLVLGWAYWPALTTLVRRWAEEPHYSHGFVVPALALLVWWVRRRRSTARPEFADLSSLPTGRRGARPSWWGLAVLAGGILVRLAGAYFYIDWFDGLSLLPVLLGLALLVGGWPLLGEVWPSVGLLFFLLPLPYQLEGALSGPLQRLGTLAGTFALQTLGLPAVSEGDIILIDDLEIGVLEACNGLGMLSAFFATSAAVALIVRRPLTERVVIFLSAVPIGVVMNLLRVTAAGLVYAVVGGRAAQVLFHDLAGWLMMPLALAALGCELFLLGRLFVPSQPAGPVPVVVLPAGREPVAERRVTAPPAAGRPAWGGRLSWLRSRSSR